MTHSSCLHIWKTKKLNISTCEEYDFWISVSIFLCLCRLWLNVRDSKCVLNLTIFSSCPGGFLRKRQRGAKIISTIPIIVITQGKPILSAMDPPIDGPTWVKDRSHTGLVCFVGSGHQCISAPYWQEDTLGKITGNITGNHHSKFSTSTSSLAYFKCCEFLHGNKYDGFCAMMTN